MHVHQPHVAGVVSVSANGRTASSSAHIVDTEPRLPDYIQEDVSTNAAIKSWEFSYDLGDTSLMAEVQPPDEDGILLTSKRKVYENSDYPMLTWANHQDEYLDEMLRLEGRGYPAIYSKCGACQQPNPTFRCAQQMCYGPALFCRACIVKQHAALPTHWIEEWNGAFFERRVLINLGLVVQLGHPCGYSCSNLLRAPKDFVLIDVTGVHNVAVNFCQCDSKIEKRQQLMRVCWWPATACNPQTCATFGVVSVHDFLRSLEFLTNNDGLHPLLDRCRAFRQIVRQYRTTLMYKCAGRGHDSTGVQGTAQGELALACRACPHDGMNLEPGWDKINWDAMPEDLRYKYFLFLAQDCNFRLINRNVSSAAKDPILGDGFGYFVNHAKYTEYLRAHVSEEEISSCSGFQAMFLANRKRVKGLRTTGVGGVTCARHNMWRSNGIGDLQLGEWYCNMDFIFFSAILNWIIFYLILSYDIACQYSKNFWTRMESLPSGMHLLIERMRAENIKEGQVHRDAFDAFDTALREAAPDMVVGWKTWVDEWESRQHTDGTESPFEVEEKQKVMSMAQIRAKLAKEELLRSGEGVEVEREDTPSTFILMGLEIEESQRHLAIAVKALANPTDIQTLDFLKRRKNLLKCLRVFRKWQRTYMPNLRRFLTASQRVLWDSKADCEPEGVRLFMPSDILDKVKRGRACAEDLANVEEELRVGEARDALATLRQGLRMLTRGQGVLRQINMKIHKAKLRYRYARNALMRLKGHGGWEKELQVLEDSDVRALNERALTAEEVAQRESVHDYEGVVEEGGIAALGAVALGESRRTLSWIWYAAKGAGESGEPTEEDLIEALRVEWCKAYARTRRWHEDVVLVEEEMRRTIEFGYSMASVWATRARGRVAQVDAELLDGLTTRYQSAVNGRLVTSLKWAGVREKGRAYLARETTAGVEVIVPLEEDGSHDSDDEENPPDYEDEGDDEVLD
ncbi:hypothetical protein B0H19DRAFT_1262187 [Mycena capillaripes]|nr:hypothetical protein B0H19DRAFT_1262187 [Mycena capillaripes]